MSRATVQRLHRGHGKELARPAAVNWSKIPYNLGAWIHSDRTNSDQMAAYQLLNQPEGRIYFSGAHLSQLPSWQEVAVMAAHRTVDMLGTRVREDRVASANRGD